MTPPTRSTTNDARTTNLAAYEGAAERIGPGHPDFEAALDDRARALARPGSVTDSTITNATHVRFVAAGVAFAIDSDTVIRIIDNPRVSRVPGAPRHLDRVMHVDGRITSAIDPVVFVDPVAPPAVRSSALLVEWGTRRLALFADSVVGLHRIAPVELAVLREALVDADAFVIGTTASMVVVLDAKKLVPGAARTFRSSPDASR